MSSNIRPLHLTLKIQKQQKHAYNLFETKSCTKIQKKKLLLQKVEKKKQKGGKRKERKKKEREKKRIRERKISPLV